MLMVHIFLTFGCLFYLDHVLSLDLSFGRFFRMSLLEKDTLEKHLSVLSASSDGRLMPLLIAVHWLPQK